MADEVVPGSCLCGAVRFEVTLPVKANLHCHCSMCRKSCGAGYVTWIVVPKAQMRMLKQDTLSDYASSDHGTRSSCSRCGSSLFCVSKHVPDEIDIVRSAVDGPVGVDPQMHIFWDDRVDWLPIDDSLPKLGGKSGLEPVDSPPKGH